MVLFCLRILSLRALQNSLYSGMVAGYFINATILNDYYLI